MIVLIKHYFEFLSLKGGCTGSSESTLVKMPHCWKSCVTAQFDFFQRGWTSWMAAAVDDRVVAIAPIFMDLF